MVAASKETILKLLGITYEPARMGEQRYCRYHVSCKTD